MKKAVFVVFFLCGCQNLSEVPESAAVDPCNVLLGSHTAVTPELRTGKDWWMPRHRQVLDRIKEGDVNLIFIGDSITHGWEGAGKKAWQKYYEPRGAVNMGFGGDRTQHVLWRLENGAIDGISPELAVVMIGTNNSNHSDNTASEIADGIQAIVCKLRTSLPQTKVLVLAIFPRGKVEQRRDPTLDATPNPQWEKNNHASELASGLADGKMIHYLDINSAFLDENGVLTREVMPDLLHPKKLGYRLWAEAMEPTVRELLDDQ